MAAGHKLEDHLFPKGRDAANPNLLPNVLDSDGAIVRFDSPKRKTSQVTVVDIGSSPNSNDGDPLRTAFIKLNNFMEASYWTNEGVAQEINRLFTEGPFLGRKNYANLPLNLSTTGNIVILDEILRANNNVDWQTFYPNIAIGNVALLEGQYLLHPGTYLEYVQADNKYRVVAQPLANNTGYDFGAALARYQFASADTDYSPTEQQDLYNQFNEHQATTPGSLNLKARNIEDALTELHLLYSKRGYDSGYYG